MIEEILVNATHRIGSTFESLFFPHPMLSAAVTGKLDPNSINQYNSTYTAAGEYHYVSIADWYVGWITGIVITLRVVWVWYVFGSGSLNEVRATVLGLALLVFGFVEHLPIKYRTYFTLPTYASLLDYKQALSILGAGLILCTVLNSWMKQRKKLSKFHLTWMVALVVWSVFNNAAKIIISVRVFK